MKVCVLYISIAALALCFMGSAASAVQLMYDNFDANAVGAGVPAGWAYVLNTGCSSAIVEVVPLSGDRQVKLNDLNAGGWQGYINKLFAAVSPTSGGGTGIVTAQADIAFAVNTAAFIVSLGNGSPTAGATVAGRIQFEGKTAWETGGGPGRLSWFKYNSGSANVTELLSNPLDPLKPNYAGGLDSSTPPVPTTWYTIKIVANVGSAPQVVDGVTVNVKCFHVYLGPRGGILEDIDQYAASATLPDNGLPFYKTATGVQISTISTFGFATSAKTGEDASDTYIDNVSVTGDVSVIPCATIAAAKKSAKGTIVQLNDKIVTAGTDQLAGAFFYIQDDTGGMRVRPFPAKVVYQGDKVSVSGLLERGAESGSYMKRVGEKEIGGAQVTVTAGPFPVPKPVAMKNRSIVGGDFGGMDTDGFVVQPGGYLGDGNMADPPTARLQVPDVGVNNVGRYAKAFGKVAYSDRQRGGTGSFFYIDDGSNVNDGSHFPFWVADDPLFPCQRGVRVFCKNLGARLLDIEGKYAVVTGIIGAIGANDAAIKTGNSNWQYCNVRVVRPVEETYTDTNANGIWDAADPYTDSNSNGQYDLGEPFTDTARKNGVWDPGEPYVDIARGNGVWDAEEPYLDENDNGKYDLGEFFIDSNGNGIWDPAEPFVDSNGNTIYDLGEPFTDTANVKNGVYDLGEPFTDTANIKNDVWDPAEPLVDSNGNGVWDGMIFLP